MRKALQIMVFICLMFFAAFVIRADELDDITKQLSSLTTELNSKESDKSNIAKQISGIRSRVDVISSMMLWPFSESRLAVGSSASTMDG